MNSKVFLFEIDWWLYCSNVKHKNGIWTGWVENGAWFLHFDENTGIGKACYDAKSVNDPVTTRDDSKLVWACDPDLKNTRKYDYNAVILDAISRYDNGEPANYVIATKEVDKEYELYKKLRAKYDPIEDDIPF